MSLIFEVIIAGLILSADSFSAAVAMGLRPFSEKDALKFALSSGGAEALVALVGSMAGTHIIGQFGTIGHWIAFSLLALVAAHMAYEGIRDLLSKEEREEKLNFHSFTKVLIVSFATSLDAFGVGVGLGMAHKPILPFVISIGACAFISTMVGLHLAKKLSSKFGPVLNLFGAIILVIIAFQMFKI